VAGGLGQDARGEALPVTEGLARSLATSLAAAKYGIQTELDGWEGYPVRPPHWLLLLLLPLPTSGLDSLV
jgi:hypothetical protein